ncbi:hypothetical protein FU658_11630 [Alkalisalibacterium limincola]|uniref:Uncharacterized protein n=1 Tax=Alkalisalibacterium limincola TaxID=2699169 RepID=A0A5C8KJJ4_9GAMM|nr:hypothetical protein FU658_11630 [Alkalisalibacterium limincola]
MLCTQWKPINRKESPNEYRHPPESFDRPRPRPGRLHPADPGRGAPGRRRGHRRGPPGRA